MEVGECMGWIDERDKGDKHFLSTRQGTMPPLNRMDGIHTHTHYHFDNTLYYLDTPLSF